MKLLTSLVCIVGVYCQEPYEKPCFQLVLLLGSYRIIFVLAGSRCHTFYLFLPFFKLSCSVIAFLFDSCLSEICSKILSIKISLLCEGFHVLVPKCKCSAEGCCRLQKLASGIV